jgi:predicted dehydrogenase
LEKLGVAQWGTKHGHAKGWLDLLLHSKKINFKGLYEPDIERKKALINSDEKTWKTVNWIDDFEEILSDKKIQLIFIEESNNKSLEVLEKCIQNNKNVMLDKPAGNNFKKFETLAKQALEKNLILELGYMFRQHEGFRNIANWTKNGNLGKIFMVRAHMSTNLPESNEANNDISRNGLSKYKGGVFYDLAGHMIDQICWIQGRPKKIKSFFMNSDSKDKDFSDNTVSIFEYEDSMTIIDIAAMETKPMARRFEVYGTKGSAIMEPFEPAENIRLTLDEPFEGFSTGVNIVKIKDVPRYDEPFKLFINRVMKNSKPIRSLDHEILVQETLMRATGEIDEKI